MAPGTAATGQTLDSRRERLAEAVVDRQYRLQPELETRFGQRGRQKCREDAAYHLTYLAEALAASRPALFREYVAWVKVMLAGRGIQARDLANHLQVMIEVLQEQLLADEAAVACGCVEVALADLPNMAASLPSCIAADVSLAPLTQAYLAALLALDRHQASRLILDAVHNGTSIKDIYIQVFQQAQWEIGRLWQANQITVAQEHYCTAVTQMIMSQLYPQIFAGPKCGRCFVGACVGGDLHEIGIRMVADFFEMDGWETVYLGASVPLPDLLRTLEERAPDVVGISATITPHISAVAQMVAAIRATPGCRKIRILVGGAPFRVVPDLWQEVKADGTSLSAQGVIELAHQLLGN